MIKVVMDTNALIQCIASRNVYHKIWEMMLDGRFALCVSNEILSEYAEILERYLSPRFAELAIDVIINCPYTLFVSPYYRFNIITEDPDDNKFVDCAVAAGVNVILTEDRHFNILNNIDFPRIKITGLNGFLDLVENIK